MRQRQAIPLRSALASAACVGLVVGCGGAAPAPREGRVGDGEKPAVAARPEVVPMTESDVGAMSEYDVAKVMKDARAGLGDCIARAAELRAYVEGGLEVTLHVGKGGRVLNVLPTRSTLGDRDAERCILSHLAKQPWPAPVGGKVGTVRQEFDFAARGRAASTMPGGWLSAAGGRAKERLASCGEGPLSVTAYVDTDGKLLSAGAATTEPAVLGQLDCAARALAEVTFPSPGSWHGKVTITR